MGDYFANPVIWVGIVALVVLVGVFLFLRSRKEDE